jgi:hypothetical protein
VVGGSRSIWGYKCKDPPEFSRDLLLARGVLDYAASQMGTRNQETHCVGHRSACSVDSYSSGRYRLAAAQLGIRASGGIGMVLIIVLILVLLRHI